jgi:orotate phosphoribosyltransferase
VDLIGDYCYLTLAFRQNGGWFSGHTAFRNGSHGDGWLEKGAIIRDVSVLDSIAHRQAEGIRSHFPEVELLLGSGECGSIVAAAVARHLSLPLAITVEEGKSLFFHRMHVPAAGQRAVLVDDLIFSGTDVRRHVDLLGTKGIEFLGVSVWVNRQSERIDGVPVHSLMAPPFSVFPEADCPLCRMGIPLAFTEVRE